MVVKNGIFANVFTQTIIIKYFVIVKLMPYKLQFGVVGSFAKCIQLDSE